MEYVIVLLFIASTVFLIINHKKKYGFDRDKLQMIVQQVINLRGFYFLLFFIFICFSWMSKIENNSKWLLLPFIWCGICAILSMYKKTRKIALILFAVILCFGMFVFLPIIGALIDGTFDTDTLLGLIIFVPFGLIMGIIFIKMILKK